MYSNCCSFEAEIIKISLSSHEMYSNKNFQESATILSACTKKSGNLLKAPRMYIYIYIVASIKIRTMLRESLNVK